MEQCQHDSYLEGVKEQQGEGCHLWGSLEVNKVRLGRALVLLLLVS